MAEKPKDGVLNGDASRTCSGTTRSSCQAYLSIVTELDINRDQLSKRQALIVEIENALSTRYNATNKLIAYTFRFGHPRAAINSADVAT
jgi:hypothetical protein